MRLHFGLGTARSVERLAIRWPSGQTETLLNLPINQVRRIAEQVAAH